MGIGMFIRARWAIAGLALSVAATLAAQGTGGGTVANGQSLRNPNAPANVGDCLTSCELRCFAIGGPRQHQRDERSRHEKERGIPATRLPPQPAFRQPYQILDAPSRR